MNFDNIAEQVYEEMDFTIPKFDEFLKRMKINDNLTKS